MPRQQARSPDLEIDSQSEGRGDPLAFDAAEQQLRGAVSTLRDGGWRRVGDVLDAMLEGYCGPGAYFDCLRGQSPEIYEAPAYAQRLSGQDSHDGDAV